ncbi:MAG: metallophosphoesterase [Candidatus Sulfotelmatobacter sp.]
MPLLPINRRKFLGIAAGTGAAALGLDSVLIAPTRPRVVKLNIGLRRWPDRLAGFTIALLSDFHYDPYFSIHPIEASIGLVNALKPQLVLLTGDFVSVPFVGDPSKGAADAEPCAAILKNLKAPHGVWAVMGNHDAFTDPDRVTAALQAQGIRVLANQSTPIESEGARFWLAGVDDVLGKTADLDATLQNVLRSEATVLMVHEPDYADRVARHPVDLQLSGHSHGGQVRLPLLPPLYLPDLGKKYVWGLYQVGGLTLYTNPGLGTVGVPARLNCPPEITLFTIHPSHG